MIKGSYCPRKVISISLSGITDIDIWKLCEISDAHWVERMERRKTWRRGMVHYYLVREKKSGYWLIEVIIEEKLWKN